jgi:hypothetical protein
MKKKPRLAVVSFLVAAVTLPMAAADVPAVSNAVPPPTASAAPAPVETPAAHIRPRERRSGIPRGNTVWSGSNRFGTARFGDRRSGRARMHMHLTSCMEWLRTTKPDEFERLGALRVSNPEAFRQEMHNVVREYTKERFPEAYEHFRALRDSETQLRQLVREYQTQQDPSRRAELEHAIRNVLAEQFDAKEKARLRELEQLEKRLEEFRASLRERANKKQELIDQRFKVLQRGLEGPRDTGP